MHTLCGVFTVHTALMKMSVKELHARSSTAGTGSAMPHEQQWRMEPGVAMVGPGRGHGHGHVIGGATVQHAIQCAAVQQFTHACIHHCASVLYNLNILIPDLFHAHVYTLNPKASTNHRNEVDYHTECDTPPATDMKKAVTSAWLVRRI